MRFAVIVATLATVACTSTPDAVELDRAELVVDVTRLDFGVVDGPKELTLTVSNAGDVTLGIESMELVPALSTAAESFSIRHTCAVWDAVEDEQGFFRSCLLAPGHSEQITVEFSADAAGLHAASLRFVTADEDAGLADRGGILPQDRIYRDVRQAWQEVPLLAYVSGGPALPVVSPVELDLGFAYPGEEAVGFFKVRNPGGSAFAVTEVAIDRSNCSPGFDARAVGDLPLLVGPDEFRVIRASVTPEEYKQLYCRLLVTTTEVDGGDESQVHVLAARVNTGPNPALLVPEVTILSPTPGDLRAPDDGLALRVRLDGVGEPLSSMSCVVRSLYTRVRTLATCHLDTAESTAVVDVVVPIKPVLADGVEVLAVQLTNAQGLAGIDTLPIFVRSAAVDDDVDQDGFTPSGSPADCNDRDVEVHPYAAERPDGVDQDCDRLIDEGTQNFDDDGDGQREIDGDCDDKHVDVYRGAPELRDGYDNDCNGIVDDRTIAHDDDGDGFSEIERDCDDGEASVYPGALEICGDGVDNDCDGVPDLADPEGCEQALVAPLIVGSLQLSATSLTVGETLEAWVETYAPNGGELFVSFEFDRGAVEGQEAGRLTWRAPTEVDGSEVFESTTITAVVTDLSGQSVRVSSQVFVYDAGALDVLLKIHPETVSGGCATGGESPGWLWALMLPLLAAGRRRP